MTIYNLLPFVGILPAPDYAQTFRTGVRTNTHVTPDGNPVQPELVHSMPIQWFQRSNISHEYRRNVP